MGTLTRRMNGPEVVEEFVAFMAVNGHPGLKIDRQPDEETRNEPAIDAVAGPLAIEHTSVDTLKNQRRDSDWFSKLVEPLEGELPNPGFSLHVLLGSDAVQRGQDWQAIRDALKTWLSGSTPREIAKGYHEVRVPHVPFPVAVLKFPDGLHGISFGRLDPGHEDLPSRLKDQCDRKAKKLKRWKASHTTLLLLESGDIAMMNHIEMAESLRLAYPQGRPAGVDQIWYADTAGQHWSPPEVGFLDMSRIWSGTIELPEKWRLERR